MQNTSLKARTIIGIAVRTTNENTQSALDIPQLWSDFHSQQIQSQLPQRIQDAIYVIYTDYESDYTGSYTTIIGCEVDSLEEVPTGMVAHTIPAGTYAKISIQGNLSDNIVIKEWMSIWNNTTLNRMYTSDFEVYEALKHDSTQAEVTIYLATQEQE